MPIRISCDECPFTTTVHDAFAGKRVKCPKCQSVIPVPAPATDEDDDEPVARPKAKVKPRVVDDEDDAPRPKAKKRRAEDDDEEDAPRPKKRKKATRADEEREGGSKAKLWIGIGVGALVLIAGGVGLFFATRTKPPVAVVPSGPSPTVPGIPGTGPGIPGTVPNPPVTGTVPPKPEMPPKEPPPPVLKPEAKFPLEVQHTVLAWPYLSPDGTQAVIVSAGNRKQPCYIWDLTGKPKPTKQLGSVSDVLPGFKWFRRDFTSKPGFEMVDLKSGAVAATCTERYDHVAAQADNLLTFVQMNYLETTGDGGQRNIMRVAEWKTGTKTPVEKIRISLAEDLQFYGFANKGQQVVFGKGSTGLIRIWNVSTGKVDRELTIPKQTGKNIAFDRLSIDEDGKRFLLGDSPFTQQRVLDATTGEETDVLPTDTSHTAEFMANSGCVLCWMSDPSSRGWAVYDLKTKAIRALLPTKDLLHVLSRDGKTLLTWEFTGNKTDLEVWDLSEASK